MFRETATYIYRRDSGRDSVDSSLVYAIVQGAFFLSPLFEEPPCTICNICSKDAFEFPVERREVKTAAARLTSSRKTVSYTHLTLPTKA